MTAMTPSVSTPHLLDPQPNGLLAEVEQAVGTCVGACYQCERCTNACPVAQFMDVKPHQVIRWVQLGRRTQLLQSFTVWVCLSCEMCTTYCPNEVHVAGVINHLRQSAAPAPPAIANDLALFHRRFLDQLRYFGRVNELWLMAAYNTIPSILKQKQHSGRLPTEARLGWTLWRQGRLHLIPQRSAMVRQLHRFLEKETHQ